MVISMQTPEIIETRDFLKKCEETVVTLKRFTAHFERILNDLETTLQTSVDVIKRILVQSHELSPKNTLARQIRTSVHIFLNTISKGMLLTA